MDNPQQPPKATESRPSDEKNRQIPTRNARRSLVRGAIRLAVLAILACFLVVVLFPYFSFTPFLRDRVIEYAFEDWEADVSADEVSLDWFGPIVFRNVRVARHGQPPELILGEVRTERPMWKLMFADEDYGLIYVDRLEAWIVTRGEWSSLDDLVEFRDDVLCEVELRDATVRMSRDNGDQRMTLDGVDMSLRVEPGRDGNEFVIEPCQLLDHEPMNFDLRDAGVESPLPAFIKATSMQGNVSLFLDAYRKPLKHPDRIAHRTRLIVHEIEDAPTDPLQAMVRSALWSALGRTTTPKPGEDFLSIEVEMQDGEIVKRDIK